MQSLTSVAVMMSSDFAARPDFFSGIILFIFS